MVLLSGGLSLACSGHLLDDHAMLINRLVFNTGTHAATFSAFAQVVFMLASSRKQTSAVRLRRCSLAAASTFFSKGAGSLISTALGSTLATGFFIFSVLKITAIYNYITKIGSHQ